LVPSIEDFIGAGFHVFRIAHLGVSGQKLSPHLVGHLGDTLAPLWRKVFGQLRKWPMTTQVIKPSWLNSTGKLS
jgi:hypothetical protein